MNKVLLLALTSLLVSVNSHADNIQLDDSTFRSGTCGGTMDAQDDCVSMGIDMETGKVYKSTSTDDKNLWNGENLEEIGQFATVDTISEEVTDALDERLQVVENREEVVVNHFSGDITNIETVDGGVEITDSSVTINTVEGAVHNSCGASVANGSTVNCETNYIVDTSSLTQEQLDDLKGDDGKDGIDGKDGSEVNQLAVSHENSDGVKTVGSYTSVNGNDDFIGAIDSSNKTTMNTNGIYEVSNTTSEVKECTSDSDHPWCANGSDEYVEISTETTRIDLATQEELGVVKESVTTNTTAIGNLETVQTAQEEKIKDLTTQVTANTDKNTSQDAAINANKTDITDIKNSLVGQESDFCNSAYEDCTNNFGEVGTSHIDVNGDERTVSTSVTSDGKITISNTVTDIDGIVVKEESVEVDAVTEEELTVVVNKQEKVDAAQNTAITTNTTTITANKAAQDAYNQQMTELYKAHDTKINSNTSRISGLEKRMDNVEVEIAGIHNNIKRLDGAIAGMAAANAMVLPSGRNGDLSVSLGVGYYNGQNGLAVGIIHDGGDYAVKATVSGTDADDWNNLTYGASVNFTTNFFK